MIIKTQTFVHKTSKTKKIRKIELTQSLVFTKQAIISHSLALNGKFTDALCRTHQGAVCGLQGDHSHHLITARV